MNAYYLSAFLPVSLSNKPNELARLILCLKSLEARCAWSSFHKIYISAPRRDIIKIRDSISRLKIAEIIMIIADEELCPEVKDWHSRLPSDTSSPNWYKQQLLKLVAAFLVKTKYYLVLDADILCVKQFYVDELFREGKSVVNIEKPIDYQRLYTREFMVDTHVQYHIGIVKSLSSSVTMPTGYFKIFALAAIEYQRTIREIGQSDSDQSSHLEQSGIFHASRESCHSLS